MSRAISIVGVRPLDWLARVRAQRSCLSAQLLGAGAAVWRHARARAARCWAWERAMIVRVSARGQANGRADGYLCAREQLVQRKRARAPKQLTVILRSVTKIWYHEIPFQLRKLVEKICDVIGRLENCMQSGASVESFDGEPTVNRLFNVNPQVIRTVIRKAVNVNGLLHSDLLRFVSRNTRIRIFFFGYVDGIVRLPRPSKRDNVLML